MLDQKISRESNKEIDSDGDLFYDIEEIEKGTSLQIANIPEIEPEFQGDLKIKLKFNDETQILINQKSAESSLDNLFTML